MMYPRILALLSLIALPMSPLQDAHALRVGEFLAICEQADRPCEEIPILNAYIGGGLDLIAGLHEDTDYVRPVYCKDTKLLFDVAAIIRYIEENKSGNENKNAMLMLVRFLEIYGDC